MTAVWILVAVLRVHEIMGGHVSEFIAVFATSAACEHARAQMQRFEARPPADDVVWKCLREEPKQ